MTVSNTTHRAAARLVLALLLVGVAGCILGPLQALIFHFTVSSDVPTGIAPEIHKAFYPEEVTLRNYFVRLSGTIEPAGGAQPPSRVTVELVGEDQDTGAVTHRAKFAVRVKADGSFSITKKQKKNIPARTVQKITATPTGRGIPAGSEVWLCVDIAASRGELAGETSCDRSMGPVADVIVIEVVDNAFNPKSLSIRPGDTVRWVLRGVDQTHTTSEMAGAWDSGFVFRQQGDFFERTFPVTEDGQTFMYSCRSHQGCCQMQGSVRVGTGAPDPSDGY